MILMSRAWKRLNTDNGRVDLYSEDSIYVGAGKDMRRE
jgi:hypothetical protein